MIAADEWHDEDLSSPSPIGGHRQEDRLRRLAQSAEAGVRHVRLHDGRHTAATLLLSRRIRGW
jgi:integrase